MYLVLFVCILKDVSDQAVILAEGNRFGKIGCLMQRNSQYYELLQFSKQIVNS